VKSRKREREKRTQRTEKFDILNRKRGEEEEKKKFFSYDNLHNSCFLSVSPSSRGPQPILERVLR
jgi:hypothetical protein